MNDLLPSSSASFALTLDQNVSREVRARVTMLQRRARRATVGLGVVLPLAPAVLLALGGAGGVVAAAYLGALTVPVAGSIWWMRRKVALAASQLNQDHDVAFVGKDGLVFFADDGFFV